MRVIHVWCWIDNTIIHFHKIKLRYSFWNTNLATIVLLVWWAISANAIHKWCKPSLRLDIPQATGKTGAWMASVKIWFRGPESLQQSWLYLTHKTTTFALESVRWMNPAPDVQYVSYHFLHRYPYPLCVIPCPVAVGVWRAWSSRRWRHCIRDSCCTRGTTDCQSQAPAKQMETVFNYNLIYKLLLTIKTRNICMLQHSNR